MYAAIFPTKSSVTLAVHARWGLMMDGFLGNFRKWCLESGWLSQAIFLVHSSYTSLRNAVCVYSFCFLLEFSWTLQLPLHSWILHYLLVFSFSYTCSLALLLPYALHSLLPLYTPLHRPSPYSSVPMFFCYLRLSTFSLFSHSHVLLYLYHLPSLTLSISWYPFFYYTPYSHQANREQGNGYRKRKKGNGKHAVITSNGATYTYIIYICQYCKY